METTVSVDEEVLLAELGEVMTHDLSRAADLCEVLFGDRRIGGGTVYCKIAVALRHSAIRNHTPGDEGRIVRVVDLDPDGLDIEVPAGPGRVSTILSVRSPGG